MVTRRDVRREGGGGQKKDEPQAKPLTGKSAARGPLLPPGFTLPAAGAANDGAQVATYFLLGDKRGLELYAKAATKHFHQSFRAVMVGPPTFTFDRDAVRLVGKLDGDHFDKAVEWAKSNKLIELHQQYLVNGGGTQQERDRALLQYKRAKQALVDHDEKRKRLETQFETASVKLVERFGKGPLVMEGVTYDASYARETVYWKRRLGS